MKRKYASEFWTRSGLCATCEHAVPRHYDEHRCRKKNKYDLICLLVGKPVSKRGWPRTVNDEIYPCRWTGVADGYVRRRDIDDESEGDGA